MFWAIPPQELESFSEEAAATKIDAEVLTEARTIVSQLIRLEWVLRNAQVDEKHQAHKARLIGELSECYQNFGILPTEKNDQKSHSQMFYSFFSPSSIVPKTWIEKSIEKTKKFLLSVDSVVNTSVERLNNRYQNLPIWVNRTNATPQNFNFLFKLLSSWTVFPSNHVEQNIQQAKGLMLAVYSTIADYDKNNEGLNATHHFQQSCLEKSPETKVAETSISAESLTNPQNSEHSLEQEFSKDDFEFIGVASSNDKTCEDKESDTKDAVCSSSAVTLDENDDYENVVAYFSDADKKKICNIMRQYFISPPAKAVEAEELSSKLKMA